MTEERQRVKINGLYRKILPLSMLTIVVFGTVYSLVSVSYETSPMNPVWSRSILFASPSLTSAQAGSSFGFGIYVTSNAQLSNETIDSTIFLTSNQTENIGLGIFRCIGMGCIPVVGSGPGGSDQSCFAELVNVFQAQVYTTQTSALPEPSGSSANCGIQTIGVTYGFYFVFSSRQTFRDMVTMLGNIGNSAITESNIVVVQYQGK